MIRINLIRQCQPSPPVIQPSWLGIGMSGLLLLLAGVGSGWWTHVLQVEREGLMQAEAATVQNLSRLQEAVDRLLQIKASKDGMMVALGQLQREEFSTRNPANFLSIIGDSLRNLQVWLDSIHMEDEILEIHGQAYVMGDIEKCLDRLESTLPMRGIPFVEVQDGTNESSGPYSFFIRVTLQGQRVT